MKSSAFNKKPTPTSKGWFAIFPILSPLIIAFLTFAIYWCFVRYHLFTLWISDIYLVAKIIIALQIIIAAARSLWGPIITIGLGFLNLYKLSTTGSAWLSSNDAWQLMVLGAFSFLITFVVKMLKN